MMQAVQLQLAKLPYVTDCQKTKSKPSALQCSVRQLFDSFIGKVIITLICSAV